MGFVEHGMVITDVKGKLNNLIYSRNKGGAYTRPYKIPFNPNTQKQINVRDNFKTVSQSWSNLNQNQRNTFHSKVDQYVYQDKLGESRTPHGKQIFDMLNLNLLNTNQSMIAVCPNKAVFPLFKITSKVFSVTNKFEIETTGISEDFRYLIFSTPPKPQKITFVKNTYRLIKTGQAPVSGAIDLTTEYDAVFPFKFPTHRVFLKIKIVNTFGQAFTDLIIPVIITP